MKLHWCCGSTYLDGYTNLDIKGVLASSLPENPNKTTLDKYYTKPYSTVFSQRERSEFIVDQIENILNTWPFDNGSISEIVMISCWEHFSRKEISFIISEICRTLKVGGKLIVDFPDIKQDMLLYYESNPDYFMELVYCNGKDNLSFHKWGYTPQTFMKLWPFNYKIIQKTYVQHDYPMIGMEVEKLHD